MPVDSLRGFPRCPNCETILHMRHMPGVGETLWHCPNSKCDMREWSTETLCQVLEPEDLPALDLALGSLDAEADKWTQVAYGLGKIGEKHD